MMSKIFFIIICVLSTCTSVIIAQNLDYSIEVKESIDIGLQKKLLTSLDSLVGQIRTKSIKEHFLWEKESELSKAIFDNIHSYEKSFQNSHHNNTRVTLLNSYPIGKGRQLNQIAYYMQDEKNLKSLQILVTIIAHIEGENITFSTPLNYYTENWKKKQVGDVTYWFRDEIRRDRAEKFAQKNVEFARRFGMPVHILNFYMVENYQEILRLLGFDYNSSSIGTLRDGYGVVGDGRIFSVMNNEDFSHDLFHFYSGMIHDGSVRNWVVEEGLAYSWGNAYYTRNDGEMAEQKELLNILKKHLAENENIDLLLLFEKNFWTDTSGIYDDLAPDFKVGRLISSLICDEVYRKHGMEGINTLLRLGSKPNHFAPFFNGINELVGINRNNFNEKVYPLIKDYN